jgi:proline iminopeptidase
MHRDAVHPLTTIFRYFVPNISENRTPDEKIGNRSALCKKIGWPETKIFGIIKMRGKSMLFRLLILLSMVFNMITSEANSQYKKVASHDLDIYYRIFGEGKPILILAGGPGDNCDRVLDIANELSKSYRAILVDQRGTGKSVPARYDSTTISVALTLDDFEAIRVQEGLTDWSVLGFSYGGYLASLYASSYPGSISSLVLVSSSGLNLDMFGYFRDNIMSRLLPSDIALAEYWSDSARVAENRDYAICEQIKAKMPGYFFDRRKSFLVSQTMKVSDFNFDMGEWMFKDIIDRNLDLSLRESNFDKPVLILAGRQDPVGTAIPQKLFQYYKGAKLVFIEKAGHYSYIEQPEIFYKAIREFLPSK